MCLHSKKIRLPYESLIAEGVFVLDCECRSLSWSSSLALFHRLDSDIGDDIRTCEYLAISVRESPPLESMSSFF